MFVIDKNLKSSCIELVDLELSSVLLKNDSTYPWLILVPRVSNIKEIYELNQDQQQLLISEISKTSVVLKKVFKPDKINVGALGNIVNQLHIHIIARFKSDRTWPHSIWQPNTHEITYNKDKLNQVVDELKIEFRACLKSLPVSF